MHIASGGKGAKRWRATSRGIFDAGKTKSGRKGGLKKSNITDNDSAKMKGANGVIQGYTGVALVDAKHQVIVHAPAFGEGQEHGLLIPVLEAAAQACRDLSPGLERLKLTADTGFHSEANLKYLAEHAIDGYVADTFFRQRDVRFADAARHKPPKAADPKALFRPSEFRFAEDLSHCLCPAGKRLYRNGANVLINGCSTAPSATVCLARCAIAVSAHPRPTGGVIQGSRPGQSAHLQCAHEEQNRQRRGPLPVQPPAGHRRAGVRQHLQQPQTAALLATRHPQSEQPMVALRYGAQHRQDTALRDSGRQHKADLEGPRLQQPDCLPDHSSLKSHSHGREAASSQRCYPGFMRLFLRTRRAARVRCWVEEPR